VAQIGKNNAREGIATTSPIVHGVNYGNMKKYPVKLQPIHEPMKTSKRLHTVARDFATKAVAALSLSVTPALAAPFTWTQNSVATQDWTVAGNWASSTVYFDSSANELIFFANTTTNLANGTNAITTNVPATLSMNALTLNGRGNNVSATTSAVDIATSASTWTIGDGTISTVNLNANNNNFNGTAASGMRLDYNLAANLTLNQTTSTFTGNGSAGFQFSGNIGEAAAGYGITKTGTSALSLSGTNNYSGGSNVSGGALVFRNLISKPATGTHAFAAGSTLGLGVGDVGFFSSADIDNAFSNTMTGNLANVTRDATAKIGIDTTAADFEHSTNIAGSPANGLVKLGINTLTLSGTNTYTGATTVLQGMIVAPSLANGGVASSIGAAPAGAGSLILSGGTLSYTGATATTDRGYTHTGAANSGINVAGAAVALTVGASNSNAVEAFNITGAAGNSLTISSLTSSSTATQANLTPTIPLALGSVTYLLPTGSSSAALPPPTPVISAASLAT
jgi:fibronectin-binding autotransporter adhesin